MKILLSLSAAPSKEEKSALAKYNKTVKAYNSAKAKLDSLKEKKKQKSTPAVVRALDAAKTKLESAKKDRLAVLAAIKKSGVKLPRVGRLTIGQSAGVQAKREKPTRGIKVVRLKGKNKYEVFKNGKSVMIFNTAQATAALSKAEDLGKEVRNIVGRYIAAARSGKPLPGDNEVDTTSKTADTKKSAAEFKARVASNIAQIKKATIDKIADPKSSARGVRLTVANGKSVDIYPDMFHPMVEGTVQSPAGLERGIKGSYELYKSEYETAKKRLASGERMTEKDKLKTTRNMEHGIRNLKQFEKAIKILGLK